MTSSASSGSSYGSSTPVIPVMEPGPRLRVQALAVALLADLQRGRDPDQDEPGPGRPGELARLGAGRAYGAIGQQIATPRCLAISAATQPTRRMLRSRSALEKPRPADSSPAHHVAVEQGDGALARLAQRVGEAAGDGRLAGAGQAGEEDDQAALPAGRAGPGQLPGHRRRACATPAAGSRGRAGRRSAPG